jgi:hypothetical protein
MEKIRLTEGLAFLIFEALFCISFIALCEIPNWAIGAKQVNACTDRWMFTAALFFPSAVQQSPPSSSRTNRGTTK